jgi:uncharacterized membrane protein
MLGLVLAIAYGSLLVLRNQSHLTKPLFQYQNGFLYSMLTLSFPHFIYYFIPVVLFLIASLIMGIDYSAPGYLIGTWSIFIISFIVFISKALLRGFKTTFMNIVEIVSSFLFCLIWIPLLVKIHQNDNTGSCSGGQFTIDLLFPIFALLWLLVSLILMILYIVRKKNKKAQEYTSTDKSKIV